MLDYPHFLVHIFLVCGSFYLGIRIENCRWRQRCNDTLATMAAVKTTKAIAKAKAKAKADD